MKVQTRTTLEHDVHENEQFRTKNKKNMTKYFIPKIVTFILPEFVDFRTLQHINVSGKMSHAGAE